MILVRGATNDGREVLMVVLAHSRLDELYTGEPLVQDVDGEPLLVMAAGNDDHAGLARLVGAGWLPESALAMHAELDAGETRRTEIRPDDD